MGKKLAISVNGGGMLGVGPLQFMCRLESDLGKKLCDVSFAYGGTSTGSIIAAGLCEGKSAQELMDLYKGNLKKIFEKYSWYKRMQPKSPTYDNTYLKKLLKREFIGIIRDAKKSLRNAFGGYIKDWDKPIYIPATHMNGESVEKVWDLGDPDTEKWFAILTSCSAPTYFDVIVSEGNSYCDGGMWANDPIMVLESGLKNSGHGDFKILSFNTGMDTPNTACGNKTTVGWLEYILDEWVARSGMSNYYECCANIGKDNVYRASPKHKVKIKMDKVDDDTIQEVIKIWDRYYDANRSSILEFMRR